MEFHGSRVTSDAGSPAYRELDDALGLTGMAADELVDPPTGKNAINWTRLSRHGFRDNAVRLQLHALACNLANFMRLALPRDV